MYVSLPIHGRIFMQIAHYQGRAVNLQSLGSRDLHTFMIISDFLIYSFTCSWIQSRFLFLVIVVLQSNRVSTSPQLGTASGIPKRKSIIHVMAVCQSCVFWNQVTLLKFEITDINQTHFRTCMNESRPVALDDTIHKHSLTYRLPPPTYTVFDILFSHVPFSQKKNKVLFGETTAGFSLFFCTKVMICRTEK